MKIEIKGGGGVLPQKEISCRDSGRWTALVLTFFSLVKFDGGNGNGWMEITKDFFKMKGERALGAAIAREWDYGPHFIFWILILVY